MNERTNPHKKKQRKKERKKERVVIIRIIIIMTVTVTVTVIVTNPSSNTTTKTKNKRCLLTPPIIMEYIDHHISGKCSYDFNISCPVFTVWYDNFGTIWGNWGRLLDENEDEAESRLIDRANKPSVFVNVIFYISAIVVSAFQSQRIVFYHLRNVVTWLVLIYNVLLQVFSYMLSAACVLLSALHIRQ